MKERYEIKINKFFLGTFIIILFFVSIGVLGYHYFNSNQKENTKDTGAQKTENTCFNLKEENEILKRDLGETKELLQQTTDLLKKNQEELKRAAGDLKLTTELLDKYSGNRNIVKKEVSLDSLKRNAKRIDYDDLFRNNERYVNTPVVYTGEVIQVSGASGSWEYRINVEKDKILGTSWVNTVYVEYSGDQRILQGDIVKFYGVVSGIVSYQAILGNIIEIPQLQAYTVEVIQKVGDRDFH